MDYTEKELNDYNDYINFIKEEISIECLTKNKLSGYKPNPEDIEIKHISKEKDKWSITYSIYYPHPVMNVIKKIPEKKNKVHGMSKKPSYQEWRSIKTTNEREEKLRQLGL